MVERKVFKTRLCQLYQRGRCSRHYCNFAHGDSELRRSFNGRQEYRGRDLRERLDRMRSPLRNYSPGRDARARHSSHGDNHQSLGQRIDRNSRKRQHLDGHGNYSEGLRMSEGSEDQNEDTRVTTSDIKMRIDELKQMHSEIKMLDSDKRKLETYLGDKIHEADTLKVKIQELEMQISSEKEEGKRITTKIKKFIKAHSRHLRLQDELKRSHAQLQKLGEQLDLDVAGPVNEDELIHTTIDDETGGNFSISPFPESQMNSPPRKRSRAYLKAQDASNGVSAVNEERSESGKLRLEKLSREVGHHDKLSKSRKPERDSDANNGHRQLGYEEKSRRGKNLHPDVALADKYKASEPGPTVPSTGIAAHAIDEDVEAIETQGRFKVSRDVSTGTETDGTLKGVHLPFLPPPPPLPQNAFRQYKGDDGNVDIGGVNEETAEVDIV